MPDDNYARWTNHDYIGSFGRIPNEPKKDTIPKIDYSQIKVPAKSVSRRMSKIILHGPQILTTPLEKSQMVSSMRDDDDGQQSFEDTCFNSKDEKVLDLIPVVHIQAKRPRG